VRVCTRVNLLRILNSSERVNVLDVCAFDWEATRNATTGQDKRIVWNRFFSILKSDDFGGGVYGRDSLLTSSD
jgi:hypothetical protein